MSSTFRPFAATSALATGLFASSLAAGLLFGGVALGCSSSKAGGLHLSIELPPSATTDDLMINGEVVPEIELKRQLVYYLGERVLKGKILDMQIQEEMDRQLKEGVDPKRFEIAQEELEQAKENLLKQVKEQYPDMEPEEILVLGKMPTQNLEDQFRQTKLFDAVFLPDNPDDWSPSTEVLLQAGGGEAMVDKIKESYAARIEQGIEIDPNDPGQVMWKTILRQLVMRGLNENTVVKTGADGLPPNIALEVNGVQVTTEEMYERIANEVTDDDRQRAREWVIKSRVTEQKLRADGKWLDDEAFGEAYAEHLKPYEGTPFPIELVAIQIQQFPSMELYKQYFRLRESFRDAIPNELTDENLKLHMDRANQLMGLAQVDAEVIFLTAYHKRTALPVEGGWDGAKGRAIEASRKLAETEDWGAVLEEYSDFWDAPTPTNTANMPQQPPAKKNKGRFGPRNRNDMLQLFGESDFNMFVSGESVADYVFFDQEPGTIEGPFRGRYGYYIVKLNSRGKSSRPGYSLTNPSQRDMIIEDYLTTRLNEFGAEALRGSEIVGR